jgi:hypothetical protein
MSESPFRAEPAGRRTIDPVDPLEDLSHQLWTMRELLQHLVFKLEVQSLLMTHGRHRWIPFANAEIDAVLTAIDDVETARATASRRLAIARGLPADTRLSELIARLGDPWGTVLAQHRTHLLSLRTEIEELSHTNHELARRGVQRSRDLLAELGEHTVDVYDPRGASVSLVSASQRVDRTA